MGPFALDVCPLCFGCVEGEHFAEHGYPASLLVQELSPEEQNFILSLHNTLLGGLILSVLQPLAV